MRVTNDENLEKAALALKRNCKSKGCCAGADGKNKCVFFQSGDKGYNYCVLDEVSPEYWKLGDNNELKPVYHHDNENKAQPQTFLYTMFYIEFRMSYKDTAYYCGNTQINENGELEAEIEEGNPLPHGEPFLYKTRDEAEKRAKELMQTCVNVGKTYNVREIIRELIVNDRRK